MCNWLARTLLTLCQFVRPCERPTNPQIYCHQIKMGARFASFPFFFQISIYSLVNDSVTDETSQQEQENGKNCWEKL